jgi:hypothetical protein
MRQQFSSVYSSTNLNPEGMLGEAPRIEEQHLDGVSQQSGLDLTQQALGFPLRNLVLEKGRLPWLEPRNYTSVQSSIHRTSLVG